MAEFLNKNFVSAGTDRVKHLVAFLSLFALSLSYLLAITREDQSCSTT